LRLPIRRIRGSNEIAYLTASYKTTLSSAQDSTRRQVVGSHLWILEKRDGEWVVTLVSWSVWELAATSATRVLTWTRRWRTWAADESQKWRQVPTLTS
jgi:hypothetical protein